MLISIVSPMYNVARYLNFAAESVVTQTYENWEWWLVDDSSTDESLDIAQRWAGSDARIHVLRTARNQGAAQARNLGISRSGGRYIAFLDSDDLWTEEKLSKQVKHMEREHSYFSYTGFQYVNSYGDRTGAVVRPPTSMTYQDALRNTTILTSTVMIDRSRVSGDHLLFPDVRRGQDTALWWRLLRQYGPATGVNAPLSLYRRTPASLSSNKVRAAKRTWKLYRELEKLPLLKSCWYFGNYAFNAASRRVGSRKGPDPK